MKIRGEFSSLLIPPPSPSPVDENKENKKG